MAASPGAERGQRVQTRRAPGRQIRRQQGDRHQEGGNRRERRGIERPDAEEQRAQRWREGGGRRRAESQSGQCQRRALADDHRDDVGCAGPYGQADSDLVGPLRHRIRDHAVDADRGQQQRDCGEAGHQQHVEPLRGR